MIRIVLPVIVTLYYIIYIIYIQIKRLETAFTAVKTNRSLHPFFFHIVFQRILFMAYVLFCRSSIELLPAARAGEGSQGTALEPSQGIASPAPLLWGRPGHSPGTQSGDGFPCTPAFT
jgi:hypothetical protein